MPYISIVINMRHTDAPYIDSFISKSCYNHGNEIILDLSSKRLPENPWGTVDLSLSVAKANDPSGIFGFVIQDGQMVLIIIALGLLAPVLEDAKYNLDRAHAIIFYIFIFIVYKIKATLKNIFFTALSISIYKYQEEN